MDNDQYEIVVGLEVHAQLLTESKLFCGDSTTFGSKPNTQVSPISLAHPGTLPRINKKAIGFAIKMGLACNCNIEKQNYFVRKHYFYPDLPKGYQISQHTTPICKNGYLKINTVSGQKKIRLNRIHMEEDAGKNLHDLEPEYTSIDFNRAGVPLIEIVTEPDISNSEEAFVFLIELRKLVRYLEICDGNMEKGSLRCDANISIRKKGDKNLGTKAEIKNLNSIRNVKLAIEYEAKRMIELLEKNEQIIQETRSFDANTGTTFSIREKEEADDYRYFADPDLPLFSFDEDFIERIRKSIPPLQEERIKKYIYKLQLSEYDARLLTEEKKIADYFEQLIEHTTNYKAGANWIIGPVKSWLNENNKEITEFPLSPTTIASVIQLIDNGKLSFSTASTKLWTSLINNPGADPQKIALAQNLLQQSDVAEIEKIIDQVLSKNINKVAEYKKGKKGLLGLFVGEVMKLSKGKADPRVTNELLIEKLKLK